MRETSPNRRTFIVTGHPLSDERYRALVEHSTEAGYVVRDGRIVYLNPAAVRLFNAPSADALLGTDILDRIHPGDHALALARRAQRMQTRREFVRTAAVAGGADDFYARPPFGGTARVRRAPRR